MNCNTKIKIITLGLFIVTYGAYQLYITNQYTVKKAASLICKNIRWLLINVELCNLLGMRKYKNMRLF